MAMIRLNKVFAKNKMSIIFNKFLDIWYSFFINIPKIDAK